MQTFLPYQSFSQSARCLDYKRLGCQRKEAMQIIKALTLPHYGWKHHPAVKMWKGYERALAAYYNAICVEWTMIRGFRHNMGFIQDPDSLCVLTEFPGVSWITPAFCLSHQSNLIRKAPEYYRPIFGTDVPDNLPYIWPV